MDKNHKDTIIYSNWFEKDKYVNVPQPAYIVIDSPNNFKPNLPTVYIHAEPRAICNFTQYLIKNWDKYHTIFTYDDEVLKNCPNAKFYLFGSTWISKENYEFVDISKKKYQISTLCGSKDYGAMGHKFRQLIFHNQEIFKDYNIIFFRSSKQIPHLQDYGNNPLLFDKFELFENFHFAITIENSRQLNYFTEKIIDCLITKTIPIYYGCPNIKDYFDTDGWIILEDIDIYKLQGKLKILDENYYNKYIDTIEKNYNQAIYYSDFYKNLNRV
jgi:hypothetical protein